ncbi:MAG: chaperonin GroEL [Anaerolineae bacterium]
MAGSAKKWQKPAVVFQPKVHREMLRGIRQVVDAVEPTLGPFPRIVLYDRTIGDTGRVPELLDDGGTIARRIIQIRGRDADVGAMLVRNVLWSLREDAGDGTATAAVLFRSVYEEGLRYLTSGGNAMRLRVHLERGLREILDELDSMAIRVEGEKDLSRLATAISQDPELGEMLGEIFDIIGEYGRLEIRKGKSRGYEREYVEGMYWSGGLLSRTLITDVERQRTELQNAAILMTDLDIENPRDLVSAYAVCLRAGIEGLAIIARRMSDVAIGMLVLNREKGKINVHAMGIKTPGSTVDDQRANLMDMAVLTGGRPLLRAAGDALKDIKPSDLGQARRVWADRSNFGIIGGKGDPRQLREHIAHLRRLYANTQDLDERKGLQERIGKLMGGSATLYVGGITETELDYNKTEAQRAADAMRGAIREGVVPGGGAALLACQPMLHAGMAASEEPEERAAYRILHSAMEAPLRALLQNTGYEPGEILAQLDASDPAVGFDVVQGRIVDMQEAGILDVTTVVKAALRSAISSAAMALTTDVLVHRAAAPEALST